VKEKMINNKPKGYRDLVDTAIKIDNELYELKQSRGNGRGRYRGGYIGYSKGAVYSKNYGDPMDLDAMSSEPSKSRGRFRGRGRGGNAERDKRRRENLCYNCGKSGH
jgi:hypothetical protein